MIVHVYKRKAKELVVPPNTGVYVYACSLECCRWAVAKTMLLYKP